MHDFKTFTIDSDMLVDEGVNFWFYLRYKTSEIIVMDQVQTYMDRPRLLRMRLSELVPLVRVELHSQGWG